MGVVDGTPRLLGGHTWVVNLRDMEADYHGGRGTVPAAACHCLTKRILASGDRKVDKT
jgi:hypothetical protein